MRAGTAVTAMTGFDWLVKPPLFTITFEKLNSFIDSANDYQDLVA